MLTAYPAIAWLAAAPSFSRLLATALWLSFLYASYNGAMVVFLTEMMPAQVRTAGFSLAYSLATAVFGGFTPAISTWLIHITGNRAVPGAWLASPRPAACSRRCAPGPTPPTPESTPTQPPLTPASADRENSWRARWR